MPVIAGAVLVGGLSALRPRDSGGACRYWRRARHWDHVDDLALLDDIVPVRDRLGEAEVLLHQDDGEPLLLQLGDGAADLLDDDRGEALGRLVEQQQMRPRAQDAGDRQHLLLAAGELGALASQPLLHVREEREDALQRQPALAHLGRQHQVLLHREGGIDPPLLGHEAEPEPGDGARGQPDRLGALHHHRALALADHAHDRLQSRGLAGAVAAQQRHHLARRHVEVDAVKDMGFPVPGLEPAHLQQRRRRMRCGRGPGSLNGGHVRLPSRYRPRPRADPARRWHSRLPPAPARAPAR